MTEFNKTLDDKGLCLKKIIENRDRSLTLKIECSTNSLTDNLEDTLGSFFSFANGIHIDLIESKEPVAEPEPNDAFSLENYQREKLKEKNAEFVSHQPEKKTEEYVLHPGDMVCGRLIKVEPKAIDEIDFTETAHESNVCLEGDIFDQEIKDISDKSELFTIALTDYTGSIYLKHFNAKTKEKLRSVLTKYTAPGNRIKVLGSLEYDDFLSATRTDKVIKLKFR